MYIEYSLRGLLNALFKHQVTIIGIGSIIVLFGLFHILNIQPTYDSRASLLVKFGQGAVLELNRDNPTEYSRDNRKEIMQSYVKILQSLDLLIPAIEEIGADTLYPTQEGQPEAKEEKTPNESPERKAASRLVGDGMEIVADTKSNVIDIRVINKNPEVAAKFAKIIVEKFIAHQDALYNASETNFLEDQIASAKIVLSSAQKDFLEFKKAVGISDLDKEIELLLSEKTHLSSLAFSSVSNAQDELAKLRAEEAEMLVTYKKTSPLLKSLKDRIKVIENIVAERQSDLAATQEEGGVLSPRLDKIDERIAYLESYRPDYEQHVQIVSAKQKDYDYYKQKGEDARINEMLRQQNITRISIIESPVVATKPVPARKKLLLIAFIMAGAFFGLGTALIFELLDDKITSTHAAEVSTALPVLMTFDKIRRGGI